MSISRHLQIVYGSPNVTFKYPNEFSFQMPSVYSSGNRDRVSLKSVRMYYSWFNLSAKKDNTKYSYVWSDGISYPVTMNDGIWSYNDFVAYLQQVMTANGHYLTDQTGTKQFYLNLVVNSVFYRISFTATPVPSTLPIGWSAPVGFVFPASATTPQLEVPATSIQKYLGFNAGSYPAVVQSTTFSLNSQNVPQVTDSSSLILHSNLCMNEYSPDFRTIASFNVIPGTQPGSLISEVPFYQDWIPIQPSVKYQVVTLSLVDQSGNPIAIEDPSGFICTLNLESPGIN